MRLFLWILTVFPGVIVAFFCYSDFIQTEGIAPAYNVSCEGQCFIDIVTGPETYTARYGCDNASDSYCETVKNGKWRKEKASGRTRRTYCCGGAFCNGYSSTYRKPTILTIFCSLFLTFT